MAETKTKLAVIQIRGTVNTHPDVKKTLELLRLKQKHACAVHENSEIIKGMLQRVKDYTTFGEIDEATFKELLERRGEIIGGTTLKEAKVDPAKLAKEYFDGKIKLRDFDAKHKVKPFFRLHPPKGGFERGGIKQAFTKKGALGQRGDKIKDLIKKML